MKSYRRILALAGLILAILAFCWLLFNFVTLQEIRQMMAQGTPIEVIEKKAPIIYLGLLYFLLFQAIAIVILTLEIRSFRTSHLLRYTLLILGSLSMILLLGDMALLSDIGKEYPMGWEVENEFYVLYVLHGVHGLFILGMIFDLFYRLINKGDKTLRDIPVKDDAVFVSANTVGLLCGITGIFSVVSNFITPRSIPFIKSVILWNLLFILIPYGLMVLVWLFIKLLERPMGLYDEKQHADVSSASLTTLIASIVLMGFVYLLEVFGSLEIISLLWFPLLLFFSLAVFSGSTLYRFKNI